MFTYKERALEPRMDRRIPCYTCACCQEGIFEGEEYFDLRPLGLGVLCSACIDDMHHYDAEREEF